MFFLLRFFVLFFLIFSLQCCSSNTNSESNIIQNARTAFLTGENIAAENFYKNYLKDFPNGEYRLEAWERIYDITVNLRKDKVNALPLLDAMLLEYANDKKLLPQIIQKLANLCSDLFQHEKSIELWIKYIELEILTDSQRNLARLQLSKEYLLLKNFDLALQVLRMCIDDKDSEGVFSSCQIQEAQVLFRMNQYDAATFLLLSLRSNYPKQSNIYLDATFLLGDIFEILQNKTKAIEMYESILESYPNTRAVITRLNNLKLN